MKKMNLTAKKVITSAVLTVATVIASAGMVFAANVTDVIKAGLDSKATDIDVSAVEVTPQAAMDAFHDLLLDNPEYYYVDTNVNCSYSGSTAKVLKVTYEDSTGLAQMNAVADSIVAEASKLESDHDKVKYVHDYLANNADYDYSLTKYTAYDILVGKSGVCQAYASAYKLIMNRLGIECSYVQSKSMQHMWNIVKVDGKWYNVDCAWSNTTKYEGEDANEAYFLKSNSYLISLGYFDWKTTNGAVATDMTYDEEL
jgi:transglutaminase-like putative cysteine protease